MNSEERRGLLYVGLAVAFLSTSPVLIVWADPMPSLVKTAIRLLVGALAIGLLSRFLPSNSIAGPEAQPTARTSRRSAFLFAAYGLITALHFFFYISSLDYTTAAHALAIIYTAPIFVTLLSTLTLREPMRGRQWLGVAVTVLGIAIVAGLEPTMTPRMAFGDFLALLSAITYAFYSVAGRYERTRYPLFVYASRIYAVAALWLLPVALLAIPSAPEGSWGWRQIASAVGLGIGPHALGHTLYNASLRRVHATYVNIIASQEVTGGILLAFFILGQTPSLNAVVGALVTLAGIALVLK
jgi:drug/metabolite transporter (DMT)-like permease